MPALLAMILPALLPAAVDGFKGMFSKWFGSAEPVNVDDKVKLITADIAKLEALAKLDQTVGVPSQWVVDLKSSFRYIAAAVIILFTCLFAVLYFWLSAYDPANVVISEVESVLEIFIQMAGSVFSFLFGDRLYLSLKAGVKK